MVTRTRQLVLRSLVALVALLACVPQSASAQDDDDPAQQVSGSVFNQYEEDGERVREPVPDVRIVLRTTDGTDVSETTTDAEGGYVIGVEEPGTYLVVLDEESLPEGVTIEDGAERTVELPPNGRKVSSFFLGQDLRDVKSKWDLLPQTIANGLKLAMIIAITSIGLSLIFATTGLSNFAHGEMVTFGAIIAWVFNAEIGFGVVLATIAAMVVAGAVGGTFESQFWRRLRRRKVSLTSMMIISIGIALSVRYIFLFFYGGRLRTFNEFGIQDPVSIGPVDLTPRSLFIMGVALAVIVAVAMFLLRARFGKAIRAVSDNRDLASSSGIDVNRVVLIVWIMGGSLAALGGVLYGLEFQIRWDMGFTLLLLMFAAITLGGLGNPFGALVGSLVVGLFVELWTWVVPNANDLKTVGALIALVVVLLVRPQGILGRKERIG
jgi:branched-chain amino acid transport system permease protein